MNGKVEYQARRLAKAWKNFPVVSYTLSNGRIRDEQVRWRTATMEDAPELCRIIKAGKRDVLSHDFGALPTVRCEDKAAISLAKRQVGNYRELLLERDLELAEFQALMQDHIEDPALRALTFA